MNLFLSLPSDIKNIIYNYDPTYKDKLNKIINILPEIVLNNSLRRVDKNKYGWSKIDSIFKLLDPSVYKSLFQKETIYIHCRDVSDVKLFEKKICNFYGYNFKKSDWLYHKCTTHSFYSTSYIYSFIHIRLFIFLRHEFQKYKLKCCMTDKQIKKNVLRGRYMDMGHYQRNHI